MENTDVFLGLHDFLERMRQPSASDLVKSIKSFIVSFSNNTPNPERDSAAVQEFLSKMEAAFRAHPLWANCTEEELESAAEGLEKYIMTKLYNRVFASLPDDAKYDGQLSDKIALFQQFVRPENLDINPNFQNETSWLLAQKELQKINMYKAPRDKLLCILNCCKVINNLLHNASIASNGNPPGADDFLPVLIYVTLKANPPQLFSNLMYIQRYRHQSRLVGEASYFFTNILSAESFISNIDAKSLSMEKTEFEKNMELARALFSNQTDHQKREEPAETEHQIQDSNNGKYHAESVNEVPVHSQSQLSMAKAPSLSELENKGAAMVLKEDQGTKLFQEYPYLFAHVGDLTINDVEDLLNNYKQLVLKYVCLSKGLTPTLTSPDTTETKIVETSTSSQNETSKAGLQKDDGHIDDSLPPVPLLNVGNLDLKLPNAKNEASLS